MWRKLFLEISYNLANFRHFCCSHLFLFHLYYLPCSCRCKFWLLETFIHVLMCACFEMYYFIKSKHPSVYMHRDFSGADRSSLLAHVSIIIIICCWDVGLLADTVLFSVVGLICSLIAWTDRERSKLHLASPFHTGPVSTSFSRWSTLHICWNERRSDKAHAGCSNMTLSWKWPIINISTMLGSQLTTSSSLWMCIVQGEKLLAYMQMQEFVLYLVGFFTTFYMLYQRWFRKRHNT